MRRATSKPITLSDKHRLILSVLSRLKFGTVSQLMYWVGAEHESSVSRPCSQLVDAGLVEQHKDLKPYVYRLSRKGCNFVSAEYKRSWLSFSALQQVVLKNDVEIYLRNLYPKTSYIDKSRLLSLGLSPGIGEHGFRFEKKLFFVLIDDYLMDSKRILRCWERMHTPNENHYDLKLGGNVSWESYADRFFLFCCDEDKLKQHKKFAFDNRISVDCIYLPATWGIAA